MLELRIDGWRKGLRFSSAHITPEHKKCGRLHGHTYAIHLRMKGMQDEWGIVLDFGVITDTLKAIGDEIDHLVLVPTESNHYSDLKVTRRTVEFRVTDPYTGEPKRFSFPRQDCALLPIPSTTAEDLARYVYAEFVRRTKFKTQTAFVEVGIDEGYGKGAWYSGRKGARWSEAGGDGWHEEPVKRDDAEGGKGKADDAGEATSEPAKRPKRRAGKAARARKGPRR